MTILFSWDYIFEQDGSELKDVVKLDKAKVYKKVCLLSGRSM